LEDVCATQLLVVVVVVLNVVGVVDIDDEQH
jgi:hypothetical protein